MKVLWVEDSEKVREMLAIAADKAARSRVQVDLVMASSLLAAENRLRLERFDLVVLDLSLRDSFDAEMAIARIANMGSFRIAVAASTPEHEDATFNAIRCGANVSPDTIDKTKLPFNRFIQRPTSFESFLLDHMDIGRDGVGAAA